MGLAWSTTDPRSMHDTASAAAPALNRALGYSFRDQALLQAALVHTSYVNERPGRGLESNERLEFLGDAVLGVIVALGFLARNGDRYANTAETELFLDRGKPSYVGGILEMANSRLYPFWGHLTEALRTGQPQNEVKSGQAGMFETLYADPARLKEFLAAMTGISRGANMAIARAFPWKNHQTFVDVGTAQGDLAAQIALANPHLRGTGFDLAQCQPIFEEYIAHLGLSGRLTFAPGDFFKQALPNADVILMGHMTGYGAAVEQAIRLAGAKVVPVGNVTDARAPT